MSQNLKVVTNSLLVDKNSIEQQLQAVQSELDQIVASAAKTTAPLASTSASKKMDENEIFLRNLVMSLKNMRDNDRATRVNELDKLDEIVLLGPREDSSLLSEPHAEFLANLSFKAEQHQVQQDKAQEHADRAIRKVRDSIVELKTKSSQHCDDTLSSEAQMLLSNPDAAFMPTEDLLQLEHNSAGCRKYTDFRLKEQTRLQQLHKKLEAKLSAAVDFETQDLTLKKTEIRSDFDQQMQSMLNGVSPTMRSDASTAQLINGAYKILRQHII